MEKEKGRSEEGNGKKMGDVQKEKGRGKQVRRWKREFAEREEREEKVRWGGVEKK